MAAVDHEAIHGPRLEASRKEIRLLQVLHNGSHTFRESQDQTGDNVHCHMFKAHIDENDPPHAQPLFNALSYAWGDHRNLANITINGKTISVGSNLENALRYLRYHHIHRTDDLPLWVDALCINQEDDEERDDQVQMMRDIYRRAHRVFCWLGEGDADTDWVIPLLRDEGFRSHVKTAAWETDTVPAASIVRATAVTIQDICMRSWWARLWVVQEVMLATQDPIFIIGCEYISWSEYMSVFEDLWLLRDRIAYTTAYQTAKSALFIAYPISIDKDEAWGYPPGITASRWKERRDGIQESGYSSLSSTYQHGNLLRQYATVEADYVYAVRALLPAEEQQLIKVDYSKPYMRVFHDAMIVAWTSPLSAKDLPGLIRELSFRRVNTDSRAGDAPSWVPDLSQLHGQDKWSIYTSRRRVWKTRNIQLSPDKQTLTLRGISFDTVSETLSVGFGRSPDNNAVSVVRAGDLRQAVEMTAAALSHETPPSSALYRLSGFRDRERPQRQILRTLTKTDWLAGGEEEHEWLWLRLWAELLATKDDEVSESTVATLTGLVKEELQQRPAGLLTAEYCVRRFFTTVRARLSKNSVFTTAAGFIGVGPGHIQVGDRIVFPFGMECPFVVRPLGVTGHTAGLAGGLEYAMVGVAEVAELMDNRERLEEAFEMGLFEEIDIHLK